MKTIYLIEMSLKGKDNWKSLYAFQSREKAEEELQVYINDENWEYRIKETELYLTELL